MAIKIELFSGLKLNDAEFMIRKKFDKLPWPNYDGDIPSDSNHIDSNNDVGRIYKMGVRTSRDSIKEAINKSSSELDKYLREIPQNIAIEDCDLKKYREPIISLYRLLMQTDGIKLAVATKLIYPFRPFLLPVIDSILEEYYWYAISIRDEAAFRRLEEQYSISWESYAFEIILLIQRDVISVKEQVDLLLRACSNSDFSQCSRMRIVESLIWFYYQRAGQFYNTTQSASTHPPFRR